jgi:WD40 repeat protein
MGFVRSSALWLAYSPDGQTLAVRKGGDGTVALWNLVSGNVVALDKPTEAKLNRPAWSPNGRTIIGVADDRKQHLWSADSGRVLETRPILTAERAFFSRDISRGATFMGNTVFFWDTKTGQRTGAIVTLGETEYVSIGADGHFTGSPEIEHGLVYVVQTEGGHRTLSAEEFKRWYAWQNQPQRVHLTPDNPRP